MTFDDWSLICAIATIWCWFGYLIYDEWKTKRWIKIVLSPFGIIYGVTCFMFICMLSFIYWLNEEV